MLINLKDLKLILNLGLAGIVIFGVHYTLLCFFPRQLYAPDLLLIHPFMLTATVLAVIGVKIVFKKAKSHIRGYAFLGSSLVKMFLSILFLFPVLKNDGLFRKEYVIQFFMIYFIYLTIEVYYLVRDLKNDKK
jgi:hypothetical protein